MTDTRAATFVSILMLTHNAPHYVDLTVRSVAANTLDVPYELVVVDNASELETRNLVTQLLDEGLITKARLLDYNSLFSKGNNLAAEMASPSATYFLLLNSDIEIKDPSWLSNLLGVHRRGISSYGMTIKPSRVDGYCALIDADLYRESPLDESHQWFWSVAKKQAQLLRDGYSVQGYFEHERFLHHFRGRSGLAYVGATGLELPPEEVSAWFEGREATLLDPESLNWHARLRSLPYRVAWKVRRRLDRHA